MAPIREKREGGKHFLDLSARRQRAIANEARKQFLNYFKNGEQNSSADKPSESISSTNGSDRDVRCNSQHPACENPILRVNFSDNTSTSRNDEAVCSNFDATVRDENEFLVIKK